MRASVVANDSYSEIAPQVNRFVDTTADLMSDQHTLYPKIAEYYASHASVNHGAKEFVNGDVHNNTAESFNVILERAKQGVFHSLSTWHLQRYVSEVVFRWNNREPAKEISKNGIKKIIYKAKPILEQLRSLFRYAVGTQLRRSHVGGIFHTKTCFSIRKINGCELYTFNTVTSNMEYTDVSITGTDRKLYPGSGLELSAKTGSYT